MKSDKPQNINQETWYYENEKSITIVHECRNSDGEYKHTSQFNIPLGRLKKSIKRMDGEDLAFFRFMGYTVGELIKIINFYKERNNK